MENKIYTMEDWEMDGTFSAEPGQQITADIYEQMLNCIPPRDMPRETAYRALTEMKIPVHAGFLMGEPNSCDKEGNDLYLAFAKNDFGTPKYYYIGLSKEEPDINGTYYFFDCMGLLFNNLGTGLPDNYTPVNTFKDDNEAIENAINYEADLYKYEYKHGYLINSVCLHEVKL